MAPGRQEWETRGDDRIDVGYDYALCAWARHFNVSEQRVKEAVATVGDRANSVREHLQLSGGAHRSGNPDRPSGR